MTVFNSYATGSLTNLTAFKNTSPFGSSTNVNGYVEKIVITPGTAANGSLVILDETTGEIILNHTAITGANAIFLYPRVFIDTVGGAELSGTAANFTEKIFLQGNPITLSGIGLGSPHTLQVNIVTTNN